MEPWLLLGWKDIRKALGGVSDITARKCVKRFNLPIKYLDTRPSITRTAFDEWWEKLPESAKRQIRPKMQSK